MLVKDPDGISNNSDTFNIHDIIGQIIINERSEYLHKHFKLKVSQEDKVLPSI